MQTQLNFFNTTHLNGAALEEKIIKCNRQERLILDIMKVGQPMTPFEVHNFWDKRQYGDVPITSIRRAMTCLTAKGFLRKLDGVKKIERYGDQNHCWEKI